MTISSTSSVQSAAAADNSDFIQKMFARLDADGDGKVTSDEFSTAMQKRFGKTENTDGTGRPDPAEVFKKMDADGDGTINVTEFKAGMEAMRQKGRGQMPPPHGGGIWPPSAEDEATQVFDQLDTNKDGTVSLAELLAANDKDSDSDAADGTSATDSTKTAAFEDFFKAADADGDGSISHDELVSLFEQLRKNAEEAHRTHSSYAADGSTPSSSATGDNLDAVA